MRHDDDKPARNVLADLIIPAAAFAFAIYYLTTITEVPWISRASAVFVSALLLVTIIIYAVRTVLRVRRGVEQIGFDGLLFEIPTQVRRAVLLGLTIAYVAVLDTLGFTLGDLRVPVRRHHRAVVGVQLEEGVRRGVGFRRERLRGLHPPVQHPFSGGLDRTNRRGVAAQWRLTCPSFSSSSSTPSATGGSSFRPPCSASWSGRSRGSVPPIPSSSCCRSRWPCRRRRG
ncbi:MAG: hypothetical protein M5U09_21755 [Gammaproteobacteria bacterium]|nr:hypothetical protein [Gammaproteobacteria bacterium]